LQTGYASLYQQNGGKHIWNTAPSGTAGNAISFTQAMTLDASGRLMLGTTSITTNTILDVATAETRGYIITRTLSTDGGAEAGVRIKNNVRDWYLFSDNTSGALRFYEGIAGSERLRITSGGFVGIGGSAPSSKLSVYTSNSGSSPNAILRLENTGTGYQARMILTDGTTSDGIIAFQGAVTPAAQYLGFGIGSSPTQMVLTGSGNVGIGTTSPSYKLDVNGGIYGKGLTADSDGGVGNALYAYNQVLSGSSTNALVQLETTWNTTGNADAIVLNVTNTASGASSRLLDLKVGGSSIFKVQRNGRINASSLPTSSAGLSSGDIWNDGGTLKIV
jgi:hypothetical protein